MSKQEEAATELNADEEMAAEKLQSMFDALNLTADEVESTPDEGEESESKEEVKEDEQADETESTPEEDAEKSAEESAAKDDESDEGVSISDALTRAAIHQGWSQEEIDEFVEASPELAEKTFGKIYESTNKISAEFAKLGRKATQPDAKADKSVDAGDKSEIDLDELKEQFGEDSAIVKTMEAILKLVPKEQPKNEPLQPDDGLRQTVNQFFIADAMKPYTDFYGVGNDRDALTLKQARNRHEVLQMADDIIMGAQAQGRAMDVAEALERAHLYMTDAVRSEVIRKDITSKITKRSKGVSLKPSSKKSAKPVAKTEKDVEGIVAQKLSKLFKG